MKMYCAILGPLSIVEREVVSQSKYTVTYLGENWNGTPLKIRKDKNTEHYAYFSTRDAAVAYLRESATKRIAEAEKYLNDLKQKLESLV